MDDDGASVMSESDGSLSVIGSSECLNEPKKVKSTRGKQSMNEQLDDLVRKALHSR